MNEGSSKSGEIERIENPEVIEKNNQLQQYRSIVKMERTQFHAGPLPSPETLEKYGKIVRGGSERIFKVFEKQVAHRISQEKLLLESDIRRSDRGLFFGFILAVVAELGGLSLIIAGFEAIGIGAVVTPFVSIIGLFVYTQQTRGKTQEKKEEVKSTEEKKKPKSKKSPSKKPTKKTKKPR